MVKTKSKLVFGAGINDVHYAVNRYTTSVDLEKKKKRCLEWRCPYYIKWKEIIRRCYCDKFQSRNPTYITSSVDPNWLYLSNFIKWVDSQPNREWQNCQPDKDLLVEGNKHYSPETCVFIDSKLNSFIVDGRPRRGNYLIGVSWVRANNNFRTNCNDPNKAKSPHVGVYSTELEAHKAWQAKKHEYACQLAELQEDSRVADALRQRYAPDKDFTSR